VDWKQEKASNMKDSVEEEGITEEGTQRTSPIVLSWKW
jgi:hypothetical protein